YYIGYLLRNYCESEVNGQVVYDYTYPMQAFSLIAAFAVVIAFALKWEDKRKHYGLEEPNYKPD
ncbi:MAG: MFS transporter, partial [Tannerellaceae bacterium]